jgi:hypothetical protein
VIFPRPLIVLAVVCVAVFALACDGGDDTPGPTATAALATPTPSGTRAPDATPEPTFMGGPGPFEATPAPGIRVPELADVRAARHEGFDRIVFEFNTAVPGYTVEYVDAAVQCGSGEPVELAGAALLEVRMSPAAAHDAAGKTTFDQQELSPGLPAIVEAEQTCDFEAVLTWVAGLTGEAGVRVTVLEDPPRLVVDVAHP